MNTVYLNTMNGKFKYIIYEFYADTLAGLGSRSRMFLDLWSRSWSWSPLKNNQEPEPIKLCGSCTSSWKIKSIRILIIYYFSLAKIGTF